MGDTKIPTAAKYSPTFAANSLLTFTPEVKTAKADDAYILQQENVFCTQRSRVREEKHWIPREQLESKFPGVFFEGENIFIEEGVLIAPGTIIRSLDKNECPANIEITGDSVVGSGSIITGNITVKDTQVSAGVKLYGNIHVEKSRILKGATINGALINIYDSIIADSVLGSNIVIVKSNVREKEGLIGSFITRTN